jgi:hypothetical protein
MPLKYLICENCLQVVARFDPDTVRLPVISDPFESHLAHRSVLPPWLAGVESAYMKCPRCPKRVFNVANPVSLLVSDGIEGLSSYRWPVPAPGAGIDRPGSPRSHDLGVEDIGVPVKIEELIAPDDPACPVCGRLNSEFKSGAGFSHHVRACGKEKG